MRNPVFPGEAAGDDQALGSLGIFERQTQVDTLAVGDFDLCKDVIAVERHKRLARAHLHIGARLPSHLQQLLVNRTQVNLGPPEHPLNEYICALQVGFGIAAPTFPH